MNYCSDCGSAQIAFKVPPGDVRSRHVCQDCGTIFYENPKIVAGCILEWHKRILLCKRAIEPRCGLWTVPAGFMENQESVAEAAMRESFEEARAKAEAAEDGLQLHGIYNLKHINQVYMIYRGRLADGRADSGEETSAVELYREDEIPWEQIAFPVIHETLRRYLEDRSNGIIHLHHADIDRDESGEVKVVRRWQTIPTTVV